MTCRRLLALVLAAASPAVASAQGTITHGDVSFVRLAGAFDSSPSADLKGASPTLLQDHVFEFGWWLRVVGVDTAESAFPVPTAQNYTGATSTLSWSTLGTGGVLSAEEVATVLDPGLPGIGDGGEVEVALTIENISASPVTVALFAMADIDLAGSASDSAQIFLAPRFLTLSDGVTDARAQLYGAFADAHLVRPFGATDVGAVLSDTAIDNFGSTGLPFGPADFTGGFQWTFTLDPSQSKEVVVVIGVDHSIFCDATGGRSLFCGDFEARPPIGWSAFEPASCTGFCGSGSPTPAGCFCDPLCLSIGDCCADACLTCGRCQPF